LLLRRWSSGREIGSEDVQKVKSIPKFPHKQNQVCDATQFDKFNPEA
jgi:hypothetical protein